MEQSLRRLAGVADVHSDYRTGLMQVQWRPSVPFDLARLKAALFTWRGGVRFGSAGVVATGTVVPWGEQVALQVAGTGQRFELRARRGESLPAPGARVRLAGDVELPRRGEARSIVRPPGRSPAACDLVVTVRSYTECAP